MHECFHRQFDISVLKLCHLAEKPLLCCFCVALLIVIWCSGSKRKRRSIGEVLNVTNTHYHEGILTIPAGTLQEGRHHQVELLVQSPDGASGKMLYDFYVNFRPRGGTCTSDQDKGESIWCAS
jgi:hypothetical protein